MRALRRFTRTALLMSAAQWAWNHREDIKREAQPLLQRGKELIDELQARRTGTAPRATVVEHRSGTERPATGGVSMYGDDREAVLVG
jgi:hypothetical protein